MHHFTLLIVHVKGKKFTRFEIECTTLFLSYITVQYNLVGHSCNNLTTKFYDHAGQKDLF